ncbi:winged helix-turn-helix transcriptional regulator [Paenibacillus frigoriresistens]|uniref:winged helix-turn-helix transcriptional regulator n=1 Tax=Paenibacillus alginolyticus TaxID=59839 RepID=UPI001563EF95|nr:winged helix-turn-helix transcriptional regulator [Paenibacillus frigoriresistens]NRF94832.1 winged helix-turn-helix transcriptional regulator [Paenibacillus frigoriresistens]
MSADGYKDFNESEGCNFTTSLDILVGKWKFIIIGQLMINGPMRYNELQRAIPGINKRMLTMQLKEMEYHKIIHRKVFNQIPPKVEYSFTEHGKSLLPVIQVMSDWGQAHAEYLLKEYGEEKIDKVLINRLKNTPKAEVISVITST